MLAPLADRARDAGIRLPLWTSSNVAGGEERNADVFDRYRARVPDL